MNDKLYSEYAVIIGTYVNACSIIDGLKKIGYRGGIVAIDPLVDRAACLTEVLFPDVKTVKRKIGNLDEIVSVINTQIHETIRKVVFMTSEEFIEPVRKAVAGGKLRNTTAHTGSGVDNDLIFDRFRFYRFVESLDIRNTPRTISSLEDPFSVFGSDFIIRVNKSWDGNRKLPRLRIVHSREEKEQAEKDFAADGLTPDMWSYQELLSTVDTNNVSVCGWYDDQFRQYALTRKIIQHPPKVGNGDVVEIFHEAPGQLVEQTEQILRALDYRGAFEMEYVLDEKSGEYKLIELNPRFWMQHGLIEKATDYALIRRAIGQENLTAVPDSELEHLYWINGSQALFRLAKGQVSLMKYFRKGVCVPSLLQSFRWGFRYRNYVRECNR